jgi:hypothetical protein
MFGEKTAQKTSFFFADDVANDRAGTLAWGAMGQRSSPSPESSRTPVFQPVSGPTGTAVTVRARDLPALTPIYLGFGGTRSSFEVLSELVTDQEGRMQEAVAIPDWATSDRTHYFVLVDVYFRPLAVSTAFHVTTSDGTVLRRGRVTDEGVRCLALREEGETGELYTLVGTAVGALQTGDMVAVTGTLSETSACRQGTTIDVILVGG